jgi:hypothetical protein
MSENKYAKYIIDQNLPGLNLPDFRGDHLGTPTSTFMFWMGDKLISGAPQVECVWLWPRDVNNVRGFPAHSHEGTEIIGFMGSNPNDIHDLGAEIEFWFDDEKYMLTKSCLLYVPGGMRHCPIVFHRVDRPILHFLFTFQGKY